MAARENQGLLIGVIILVMVSLILAVVAFLGTSKAYENFDAKESFEKQNKLNKLLVEAQSIKGEIFKAMIGGHGPAAAEIGTNIQSLERFATQTDLEPDEQQQIRDIVTSIKKIEGEYKTDMEGTESRGEDGQLEKQSTYRERIRSLVTVLGKQVKRNSIQDRQTTEAEKEAKEQIARKDETLTTTIGEMKKLRDQLKETKRLSLEKETKLAEDLETAKQVKTKLETQFTDFQEKANKDIRIAENSATEYKKQNAQLKAQVALLTKEVYDRPDGEIVKVATPLNAVFINLGATDGLKKNLTFSVYDASVNDFGATNHKAKIEVTRVLPYRAEARVIQENPVNPILPGDQILTPTWDPGFGNDIAIFGLFDIDGDGVDDTDKFIGLVERNGGNVIARHDMEGNVIGKINSDVRFLVKGNSPILGENAAGIGIAMDKLEKQAEDNNVTTIGMRKFLNRMGARIRPKTVQLSRPNGGFTRRPSDVAPVEKNEDK